MAKILIVEDEPFLAKMYKKKLENGGIIVEIADDGSVVIDQVSSFQPDLILLDIMIPKIDGFTVLKELKSNDTLKHIPVIMTSNLSQEEDIQKCKDLGAEAYLVKSDNRPNILIEKIREVLAKKSN